MKKSVGGEASLMGRESESSVVNRALKGDRSAFDGLIRLHEPELRVFLRRKVGPIESEDIMQDVWIAAWNARGSFDRRSRFKTWLYGIALNKCRDHYRSRAGQSNQRIDVDAIEVPVHEERYQQTELQQVLRVVLDDLTENQREVLELYYFAELSLPEIGQMLNRNLNTVKYQFYRAHVEAAERLKPALEIGTGIARNHDEYHL